MGRLVFEFRNMLVRSIALTLLALAIGVSGAIAQSGDLRAQDQPSKPPAAGQSPADTAAKDSQRKTDEFVEAAQAINGPAGNPECVWLGRRVVGLMWRDDMDTAFRHLDLYDRFGCPGPHIQAAFRCVVRQGNTIDPKNPRDLNTRVHSCWLSPTAAQTTAAAPPAAAVASSGSAPAPPAQNSAPAPAAAGTPSK